MDSLPLDITAYILCGLPNVSLLRCREVCSTWRGLLPKPKPKKKGLLFGVHRYSKAEFFFSERNNGVDEAEQITCLGTLTKSDHSLIMKSNILSCKGDEFTTFMVGSCKGLVCYADKVSSRTRYSRNIYICNPSIGEQIQFPDIHWNSKYHTKSEAAIGFGYDTSSKKYKVVRILLERTRYPDGIIQVFTLEGYGCSMWRSNRKSEKPILSYFGASPSAGVFSCGALYWIDEKRINPKIVSFDLEHETVEIIPSIHSSVPDANHVALMELGSNLCVLEIVPSKRVRIWELRSRRTIKHTQKRGGYVSPWGLKFDIAWEHYSWFEPFALSKNDDKCLLWYNAVLSCYDPETKTLRKLYKNLKKLMDRCTPSVYTTTRGTPHVKSYDWVW